MIGKDLEGCGLGITNRGGSGMRDFDLCFFVCCVYFFVSCSMLCFLLLYATNKSQEQKQKSLINQKNYAEIKLSSYLVILWALTQ
jgi:hypothetical protein